MQARIVLVDDHELVRAGICSLLLSAGHQVVAEGSDGDQVECLIEAHNPDVVMLELTLRRFSGLEALAVVRRRWPTLPVILLSMHNTRDCAARAMQIGASGYLLKDCTVIELQLSLQAVLGGHRYLSPGVADLVINTGDGQAVADPSKVLTSRQLEVLLWLVKGKSNKEIAFLLKVSVKTVDAHRAQLMARLEIHDVAGLVLYALRRGIIKLDE